MGDSTTLPGPGSAAGLQVVQPGDHFGRYTVIEPLGAGGMGTVYAAHDPKLDRRVALKLVGRQHASDGLHARLLREAKALAQLSHPNVITIHDVGSIDGEVFVAMELVDGQTLADWLLEKRSPRQIVDAFVQAGRGLAAAHEQGLVHRDFKPGNVLVGNDGRVRLLDFGLARADTSADTQIQSSGGMAIAGDDLTRTGTVMGTPAYMSPEQHRAEEAGPTSDQFSFCVALYEALYGTRPFAGNSLAALAMAVARDEPPAFPAEAKVPARLEAILTRGLRARPADRYPDMRSLLRALGRRRRRGGLAVLGVAALTAAWGLLWEPGDRCAPDPAKIDAAWGSSRRAEIKNAFIATGAPFAETTWRVTSDELSTYVADWTRRRRQACTAFEDSDDAAALDLTVACLERRWTRVQALSDVFATANLDVVSGADEAVSRLDDLARCDDLEALTGITALPDDASMVARIEAARAALGRASSVRAVGRYEEALRAIEEIDPEVRAIDYPPLRMEAWHERGQALDDLQRPQPAAEAFEQAFLAAVESGDDRVAVLATVQKLVVVGYKLGEVDAAQPLLKRLEAWRGRTTVDADLQSHIDNMLGLLALGRHEFAEAAEHFRAALPAEGTGGERSTVVLNNLVLAEGRRGNYKVAIALVKSSVAANEARFGPDHPRSLTARKTLAFLLGRMGQADEQLALMRGVVEATKRVFPEDHPEQANALSHLGVALLEYQHTEEGYEVLRQAAEKLAPLGPSESFSDVLSNLSVAAKETGRYEQALRYLDRSEEVLKARDQFTEATRIELELNRGTTLYSMGRFQDSLGPIQTSLTLAIGQLGPDHPSVGVIRTSLGGTLVQLGRAGEALAEHEIALGILEKQLGPDHAMTGYAVQGLGEANLELGRPKQALVHLLRAKTMRSVEPVAHGELADTEFCLAKARYALDPRDPQIAEHVAQARTRYHEQGSTSGVTKVDDWRSAHQ